MKIMLAMFGNPFFLIKARMQAYSPALRVGTQHFYRSSFDALQSVWRAEGPRGMIRGMDAAVLRTSMGSSVGTFRVIPAPRSRAMVGLIVLGGD